MRLNLLPTIFRHVLDYLRDDCIYDLPALDRRAVMAEADFLELKGLRSKVEALPQVRQQSCIAARTRRVMPSTERPIKGALRRLLDTAAPGARPARSAQPA